MTALTVTNEYRALMMLDKLPPNCVAWLCTGDEALPHVKPGEWVVLDTSQRDPIQGEMFVIKFPSPARGREMLCLTTVHTVSGGRQYWMAGSVRQGEYRSSVAHVMTLDLPQNQKGQMAFELLLRMRAWSEGPYDMEGKSYDHLCKCLMGVVIGIYVPSTEGPQRTAP